MLWQISASKAPSAFVWFMTNGAKDYFNPSLSFFSSSIGKCSIVSAAASSSRSALLQEDKNKETIIAVRIKYTFLNHLSPGHSIAKKYIV